MSKVIKLILTVLATGLLCICVITMEYILKQYTLKSLMVNHQTITSNQIVTKLVNYYIVT